MLFLVIDDLSRKRKVETVPPRTTFHIEILKGAAFGFNHLPDCPLIHFVHLRMMLVVISGDAQTNERSER